MWQSYLCSEKSWDDLQPSGSRRYNMVLIILSIPKKHSNGDSKKYDGREDSKYKAKILVCRSLTCNDKSFSQSHPNPAAT